MKKLFIAIAVLIFCIGAMKISLYKTYPGAYNEIENFARERGISMREYPQEIVEMLSKNSETEQFVKNWPTYKWTYEDIQNLGITDFSAPPLLMQWDMRWGYRMYSGQAAALSGCGPLCLAMAAIYTLEDDSMTPVKMMEFAETYGYDTDGSGSMHSLIYEGGPLLGLDVENIEILEYAFTSRLEKGNCIIRLMGPGDFTSKGHFVLLAGMDDGLIKVNDPNSIKNSEKLWDFEDIQSQIRSAWQVKKYA